MTTETYYEMAKRYHVYARRLHELGVEAPSDANVHLLADLVEQAETRALTLSLRSLNR